MKSKCVYWLNILLRLLRSNYSIVPKELSGKHDCGPRALFVVLPGLALDEIVDAFMHSCDWWPYRGVTNKEYNIALSYLNLKDCFEYVVPEKMTITELRKHKSETYIVLIYGHYTVIRAGRVVDISPYPKEASKSKVYCYWKLI